MTPTLREFDKTWTDTWAVVPEYYSDNKILSKLFHDRLKIAAQFIWSPFEELKILDVGCGLGELEDVLTKKFPKCKITAIDVLEIVEVMEHENTRFIRADLLKDKEKYRDSYDVIFCLDTLEHIKDLDAALERIKEVSVPYVQLIISTPTETILYKLGRMMTKGKWDSKFNNMDIHWWDAKGIEKKLVEHGWEKEKSIDLPSLIPLFKISRWKIKSGEHGFI